MREEGYVNGSQGKQLFDRLLKADTEAEVIAILKVAGYWENPTVWRFYGDQPENWATVGNQQSRAEQALIGYEFDRHQAHRSGTPC
jgi:hypothetical protein